MACRPAAFKPGSSTILIQSCKVGVKYQLSIILLYGPVTVSRTLVTGDIILEVQPTLSCTL